MVFLFKDIYLYMTVIEEKLERIKELKQMSPVIQKMLGNVTNNEIIVFDFVVDYSNYRVPKITLLFGFSGEILRKYNGDGSYIIDEHLDSIKNVLSIAGFPELTDRTVRWTWI